jgi:hypothetical protein
MFNSYGLRPSFAEIETSIAVENYRSDVPIPVVRGQAAYDAPAEQRLKLIFTQSGFSVNIAVLVEVMHRQIGVLLHPLPDD